MDWGKIFGCAVVVAGGLASLAAWSPAAAVTAAVDPVTGLPEPGYAANIPVTVPVTAKVTPNCGFDPGNLPSGTLNWGDLNNAFDGQVNFGLRCNTPLNVGVVSSNGGLKSGASVASGYTALRDYQVELFLQGSPATADANCFASALVSAGGCSFRGPATSTASSGGLFLNGTAVNAGGYVSGSFIRVHDSAYAGANTLVASPTYADTLTLTLSAVI